MLLGVSKQEEAVGAAAVNVVAAGERRIDKGGARGGRELSFWGFTKQLATHMNFWL